MLWGFELVDRGAGGGFKDRRVEDIVCSEGDVHGRRGRLKEGEQVRKVAGNGCFI